MQQLSDEQAIAVDNAVRRITDILALDELIVAQVLGFDDDGISEYLSGGVGVDGTDDVMVTRALELIELYTLLETLLSDDESVRRWLNGVNTALGARPLELIATPEGLHKVLAYARATVHR
jgi:hypothetical protein